MSLKRVVAIAMSCLTAGGVLGARLGGGLAFRGGDGTAPDGLAVGLGVFAAIVIIGLARQARLWDRERRVSEDSRIILKLLSGETDVPAVRTQVLLQLIPVLRDLVKARTAVPGHLWLGNRNALLGDGTAQWPPRRGPGSAAKGEPNLASGFEEDHDESVDLSGKVGYRKL